MSAYFVAGLRIHDAARYDQYLEGFDAVFERYEGEVVLVDETPAVLEGAWPYSRLVLLRFPDEAALRRWYESPEYQRLARLRHGAADGFIVVGHEGE